MDQPQGFVDPEFPDFVCHLKKSLYGLKQAPRAWFERFSSFLVKFGFTRSVCDYSMFIYTSSSEMMILLLYVDDIILTGNSDVAMDKLVQALSVEFAMRQLGDLSYFLGIEAHRNENSLALTQKKYNLELLKKTNMLDCKPCSTPVVKESRASIHDGVLLENAAEYRTIVGSLQYLTNTIPDISFGVNYVSQFMHAPTDVHYHLVKRILRYLKGTVGVGITLHKGDISTVRAYTDSDWDGCPDTRRSTSGYAIFLGSSLISWSSKKQPTVSRSSAEAEYKCLSVIASELEWLSNVFKELQISVQLPMQMLCDNTSAIFLASNPVFHSRAKHIEVQYHVVRDLVDKGFVKIQHVPYESQIADLFTKGLCSPTFTSLLQQLLGDTSSAAVDVSECQNSSCTADEEELSSDNEAALFSGLALHSFVMF
ncbi:uncharacterized protein LOC113324190 [Papaver somniferum]|uniref:uncharacterized protein LOC113324190 n=1 Tax=Papaver somniferum TaxID=3469 RepID=UPI000E7033A2|nr:uncharacterized protein LOC113324190 [Papaver somniferum]